MFNFNEMDATMGYVTTTTLHPPDSTGDISLPNYSNSANLSNRQNHHHHHHHLLPQQSACSGHIKSSVGDYGDTSAVKSSHLSYLGTENVKRFSVNNLLNLVGYTELSRNQGMCLNNIMFIST